MNVAFYHYSMQAGGAERTIANLSNYLVGMGDQVSIITMDNQPSFYSLNPKVKRISLNTARVSRHIWQAIWNNLYAVWQLRKVMKEIIPDVVVCFGVTSLLPTWMARGMSSYKIVGSERTNPFLDNQGFWNRIKKWMSKRCNGYIFQTAGARSYYPKEVQKRSIVLGNPLDPNQYTDVEPEWDVRANLCAAGRLVTIKCFDDLLEAFSIVVGKYPEITLELYGDGPEEKSLKALTEKLGLQKNVRFCGRMQSMQEAYFQHKIFVLTSSLEGMPNVLIEAMASGCACVATNCDFGPSDLIWDGENGFLVPVHDVKAIAERICRLIEDDALAQEFSRKAKEIRKSHNVNAIGSRFRAYLFQMIEKGK